MSCHYPSTYSIADNITYALFEESLERAVQCPETYIRPDPGGAMMPWLYTLFLLLFHLPAVVIRAVRWESAQYLALGLASFGIAVTIQSYVSTSMRPKEILVWMPLTLILDVGAMLQMVVLILEPENRSIVVLWGALEDVFLRFGFVIVQRFQRGYSISKGVKLANDIIIRVRPGNYNDDRNVLRDAIVALFASIFGLTLFVLQLYGLAYAAIGRKKEDLNVRWCSPSFRDFAVAITTGNCEKYTIYESSSNGIGCIEIPADQQREWLTGTIAGLCLAIVCQFVDLALLLLGGDRQCRGTRLRRPWLTMFSGVITLVVLISFGTTMANGLPQGVTESAWIYRKEPKDEVGRVCHVRLWTPGLRGMMIGYNDGLFGSWGPAYFGQRQ